MSEPTSSVYVIIPVYNEAPVIRHVLTEVLTYFTNVICVDDGSSDRSAEEIARTDATLIRHPINLGQGAALQTGLDYALDDPNAEYFVTFDSDGQHRIEDALKMLEILRTGDYDIVLGSRFLGSMENGSLLRKLLLKAAVVFSNATTGIRLTDAHNGLRAFNRAFAEEAKITIPHMAHATELTHRIAENKHRYIEVPVTVRYTEYSKSKGQSIFNAVNISFDLLMSRITRR
jgi:glycosyltransferase involved in cell wall biosynthesis